MREPVKVYGTTNEQHNPVVCFSVRDVDVEMSIIEARQFALGILEVAERSKLSRELTKYMHVRYDKETADSVMDDVMKIMSGAESEL